MKMFPKHIPTFHVLFPVKHSIQNIIQHFCCPATVSVHTQHNAILEYHNAVKRHRTVYPVPKCF